MKVYFSRLSTTSKSTDIKNGADRGVKRKPQLSGHNEDERASKRRVQEQERPPFRARPLPLSTKEPLFSLMQQAEAQRKSKFASKSPKYTTADQKPFIFETSNVHQSHLVTQLPSEAKKTDYEHDKEMKEIDDKPASKAQITAKEDATKDTQKPRKKKSVHKKIVEQPSNKENVKHESRSDEMESTNTQLKKETHLTYYDTGTALLLDYEKERSQRAEKRRTRERLFAQPKARHHSSSTRQGGSQNGASSVPLTATTRKRRRVNDPENSFFRSIQSEIDTRLAFDSISLCLFRLSECVRDCSYDNYITPSSQVDEQQNPLFNKALAGGPFEFQMEKR